MIHKEGVTMRYDLHPQEKYNFFFISSKAKRNLQFFVSTFSCPNTLFKTGRIDCIPRDTASEKQQYLASQIEVGPDHSGK